ncbi:MAG TPA: hypothetical protein ENH60_09610 [Pricia sp.]|uniref:Uncharacterized protein n=1 Tax=Pricia antarctica TaxID=641691 RepID=A0A831VQL4_9FLAO|nr:hypothetical protein [Pricia sp.]HEA19862.1 hypothetical protein [Pricia antarctica]
MIDDTNAALFENMGRQDGQVHLIYMGDLSEQKIAGHTTSPNTVDWDNNVLPDLLLGVEDGHQYYLKNQR